MRQDLQLSFVDILGYILPGTILSSIVMLEFSPISKDDNQFEFYLIAISIGYLIGHVLLMFHRMLIGKIGRFLFGDLAMNVPILDKENLDNKRIRRKIRWHNFMRNRFKMPEIPKSLSDKIWHASNLNWNNSKLKIKSNPKDIIGELKYLYWWEMTQWEILYKQERRLRALVILFGNSCYALSGLGIYLILKFNISLGIICFTGALFCFLVYCRYRYYRLRHINIHGYYQREKRRANNSKESM